MEDAKEEKATKGKEKKTNDKKRKNEPPPASGRERRSRKTAEVFEPENFKEVDRSTVFKEGRGKKLRDISAVKNSVEGSKLGSDELTAAFKLLYTQRGAPPKKDMKANILEFSGFLTKESKDVDSKKQKKLDEETEVRIDSGISSCGNLSDGW
jgi:hypothetical protein